MKKSEGGTGSRPADGLRACVARPLYLFLPRFAFLQWVVGIHAAPVGTGKELPI